MKLYAQWMVKEAMRRGMKQEEVDLVFGVKHFPAAHATIRGGGIIPPQRFWKRFRKYLKGYKIIPPEGVPINDAKTPLIPVQLGKGFGWMGVLMADRHSGLVQCHICGGWYRHVGIHTSNAKGHMPARDYKIEYGFTLGTALCNEKIRRQLSLLMKHEPGRAAHMRRISKGGIEKARLTGSTRMASYGANALSKQNKRGICHLQILHRLRWLGDRLKRTPTFNEYRSAGLTHYILSRRFGSVKNAMRLAGLSYRAIGIKA